MNYIPYTYLVKCPDGHFYYGVKYANNANDVANPSTFWIDYFTSSKEVKALLEIYDPSEFEFEIRKTFQTKEDAIQWEHKVNRRLTVSSDKFLNRAWREARDQSGENNGMFGKTQRKDSLEKAVMTRRINCSYNPLTGSHLHNKETHARSTKTYIENRKRERINGICRSKVLDLEHIYEEFTKFEFPVGWNKNLTGTAPTEISYFTKWYITSYPDKVAKSKDPYSAVKSTFRKYKPYLEARNDNT